VEHGKIARVCNAGLKECKYMIMKNKLPVGIENFEEMRTEGFYYIDKTGLIKELLHSWGKVNLFTRPRRFGKSLNMNMLKNFFEIGCKPELFAGLDIAKEADLCQEYMGKFPVISISLKGACADNYETARDMMCATIEEEAMRFQFLLDSVKLSDKEKEKYAQLITGDRNNQVNFAMSDYVLMTSLRVLSSLLQKHYEQKVIILIDEYDVPLAKAFDKDYYEQMIVLIRNMFEQALKTNDSMYFSVLTGCLRISKESIFTGLNNPKVLSIIDVNFDEYFGFTDQEVRELLEYDNLLEFYPIIKEWYDGYQFGNVSVYCPWDVICYCDKLRSNRRAQPEEYWINTSGNDVVRRFIEMSKTGTTKREIEQLIEGNTVTKTVRQELTYWELYDSIENIWSVLFTTGYLTSRGESDGKKLNLAIPNTEIRNIFISQIAEWFLHTAQQDGAALDAFSKAFRSGDPDAVQKQFQAYLKRTISIRDTFVRKEQKENFYHGLLLGLLGYKETWGLSSNKESGEGYSDILIEIEEEDIGIVIEVKYSEQDNLESDCKKALAQIENRNYQEWFQDMGVQTILKYGIACFKKRCKVLMEQEECNTDRSALKGKKISQ
jgi:hypothetical protein